jgi:hypothetical protein
MLKLPHKFSFQWYWITAMIFAVLLGTLILSRLLLDIGIDLQNSTGFAVIALTAAVAAGVGGFLGGRVYFVITIVSYFIGANYMLYVAAARISDGWSDLTSVVSFMFIAVCGIAAGLMIQLLFFRSRKA